MIKKNQELFNRLNVLSDAFFIFLCVPAAFYLRFYVLPNQGSDVPLRWYLYIGAVFTAAQVFTIAAFGLYQSFRHTRLRRELFLVWEAGMVDMAALLSWLFLGKQQIFSRMTFCLFFLLDLLCLSLKRIALRRLLRLLRRRGRNLKHILIFGSGKLAARYQRELSAEEDMGYRITGFVADSRGILPESVPYLGRYQDMTPVLERYNPDEAVAAIETADFGVLPEMIAACEKTGIKLSIIPFYAEYMPPHPQFDDFNGIPLMNIRAIPLDNLVNAFLKRTLDVVGSTALLTLSAPVMLVCAVGVKLSSPGPVLFKQQRIGRGKRPFTMYKFRSMRLNEQADRGWSRREDDRRTRFGAFLRKYSLDEFPQFWNVLKGDMSLVGPRPEVPFHVDRLRDEVPLYMVKHQVRPGITGWAQINGLRGDTSIRERIEHDVYYIEHWSFLWDLQILFITVFGGKFINNETLG